ncbi:S8 family serine peptidase [Sphingomonas sp. JC676]|uniref:S8 family peptidase n=1 Tax=Sphingomonas sp. JC676 TaxID=2768065 RepID=UPI001657D9F7|nr:S8 family serine peptidase [Sphingomonas sp. JC676]MBC9032934.1 S8 family serine peptidase [Sphingomonas sp. JC676]
MPALPDDFDRKQGISRCWERGARGAGITIGVIDTSLDPTHPELEGWVESCLEFVEREPAVPAGPDTHGTSIARNIRLVAPEARIVGLSIFPASNTALRYNAHVRDAAARAVRESIARYPAMRVINMSFAIPRGRLWGCRPGARCALCRAVNDARDAGIAPVAAAGNTGPHANSIECPGIAEKAITVGAVLGSKDREAFASTTPAERTDRYGTSYSTAYFSGGAALLMSAAPKASVDEVEEAFARVTSRMADGSPARANFANALDWLIGPDQGLAEMMIERLHWIAGNRDAQRPDNQYVVEALDIALLFIERGLIRRGEVERANAMAERLDATIEPDCLPAYHARLMDLQRRMNIRPI